VAPRAWVVSHELWELVEPLLPSRERPFRHPARRRLPDRQCLQGILSILHTGIPATTCPPELGLGSGVTCGRRLEEGSGPGCGSAFTACLSTSSAPPMRSTSAGRSSTPARCRRKRGPEPGRPRSARLQAPPPGRRHWRPARGQPDRRQPQRHHPADPLVDAVPPIAGTTGRPAPAPPGAGGRPRLRPRRLPPPASPARHRPQSARRQTAHGSGLGRASWPVERSLSWLHQFRRLLVRFERRADMHEAFLVLGCCLICLRKLQGSF
jgi:transposase